MEIAWTDPILGMGSDNFLFYSPIPVADELIIMSKSSARLHDHLTPQLPVIDCC